MLQIVLITLMLHRAIADNTKQDNVGKYQINPTDGIGRAFDGIGGLSAGASSRLLMDYQEPYRSNIFDLLFLPNTGASLHVLKVEIGGDVQSTDGVEASHMHNVHDENYERGYEWTLMVEAKKRNPNIIIYALSWGFPGWVSEGTGLPFTNSTALYIVKWLRAANSVYGVNVDYVGIWNEKSWDKQYVLTLRSMIANAGLTTKIVAHDSHWDVCDSVLKDSELAAAVDILGAHYPQTNSTPECEATGKPLWASEDFSKPFDTGGQIWARTLNQNYVNGNITSCIAWSLIAAWYDGLPFQGDGLMSANQPWSGYYQVDSVIWVTAHTTQFTQPGWRYFKPGYGSGMLSYGGSYVTLTNKKELTIIIETMADKSPVQAQTAFFTFATSLGVTKLNIFYSILSVEQPVWFCYNGSIEVVNGVISINLVPNAIYTLSTLNGTKVTYHIPQPMKFPIPYFENFNNYSLFTQPAYFSDQGGSFQIDVGGGGHDLVLRQVVTDQPVIWLSTTPTTISIIGDATWSQLSARVSVFFESSRSIAFLATNIKQQGVFITVSAAIVLTVSTNGIWSLCNDTSLAFPVAMGPAKINTLQWIQLALAVYDDHVEGYVNGIFVVSTKLLTSRYSSGWVGIGSSFDYVQFDDFSISPN